MPRVRLPDGVAVKFGSLAAGHYAAVLNVLGGVAMFELNADLAVYLHRVPARWISGRV